MANVHLPVLHTEDAPPTRAASLSALSRATRAKTISTKRMTKRELAFGKMIADAELEELGPVVRPRTRGDCEQGERPCPFVSCKHHLYLDVSARTGAIKLNFPDLEVWEMNETCALDVA